MGFVYAYFIMVPSVIADVQGRRRSRRCWRWCSCSVSFSQPVLPCASGPRAARPGVCTFMRLAAGAAMGFFLRLATSEAISHAAVPRRQSFYDLAWIVPFLCYLWAALETPPSPRRQSDRTGPRRLARGRGVGGASAFSFRMIGFGLLRLQPIGDPGDSVRLLLTVLSTVGGLGVLTLRLSVAERRAGAGRRAHPHDGGGDGADRRPDPHHEGGRHLRARQRRLRAGARLHARRARAA